MKRIILLSLVIFFNNFIYSCKSDPFKGVVMQSIRDDHYIDNDECQKIRKYIIENSRKYHELFINDKLDEKLYLDFLNNYLNNELKGYNDVKIVCNKQEKSIVNIYRKLG